LTSRKESFFYDTSNVAFAVVMLAAYMVFFSNGGFNEGLTQVIVLIISGLIYLGLGIYGFAWVVTRKSNTWVAAYFVIQLFIGGLIVYMGKGFMWLVLLPLASHSVFLPLPGTLSVCFFIVVEEVLQYLPSQGWLSLVSRLTDFLAAVVFVAVFTRISLSEEKARRSVEKLVEELSVANNKLREYAARAERLAIIEERNRLAREIHDSIGHYLTSVNIQIKAGLATLDQDPQEARSAFGKAQTLTQEALTDIRRSVASLRADPVSNQPLSEAVESLLIAARASGLVTNLQISGTPRKLSDQAEFTIYRTVQEALTNVIKHAQASQVEILLDYQDSQTTRLVIQDNGVGTEEINQGFGLLGVSERVQLLGGEVNIQTSFGKGFILELKIPL
jgi:signal transduction histidine kinase